MKNFLVRLLAGVAIPAAITSSLFSSNALSQKISPAKALERPYVIEIIKPDGTKDTEVNGISKETDPFLISETVVAKPFKEDKFTAFPSPQMGIGGKITLYRAPDYKVKDGKKDLVFRSWSNTVGDLLAENDIELGQDDKINFSASTQLELNMEISIIRVAKTTLIQTESIPFTTTKRNDPNLDQGKTKVEQAGKTGKKNLFYLVTREDGVEVSRVLQKTEVAEEPVTEKLIIGTKPVITVRCKFNDIVAEAAAKYLVNPNALCTLMMKESNGNTGSISGGGHLGLFQYTSGFWADASAKAGFAGASWQDARAQIFTTAWAISHGQRGRWP